MSDPIRLAIAGCGGMGHRHLYGLEELRRAGLLGFELVAACDPLEENAASLAEQAQERLGERPAVVEDLAGVSRIEAEALDICADPRHHHMLVAEALERGWHAMVEKPMGLTAQACDVIRRAAEGSDRVVSVAENYRRDPMNRLAKALLDAGAIGTPRFLIHHTVGGGDRMLISMWRHQKNTSGVLLDVGVHFTDMMEYLMGNVTSVYAQTRLHEPIRRNPMAGRDDDGGGPLGGVYGRWQRRMPETFEATAEDAVYATLVFECGAVGQYLEEHAGHGRSLWQRSIYGSSGSMDLPGDRSGGPITVTLEDRTPLQGEGVLDLVPDFRLDDTTAALFGGDRLGQYDLAFSEIDRKIIGIEYREFEGAIRSGNAPEVGPYEGARAVAVCYAMLESGVLGGPVTVEEVLAGRTRGYQDEIDAALHGF